MDEPATSCGTSLQSLVKGVIGPDTGVLDGYSVPLLQQGVASRSGPSGKEKRG